MLRLGYLRGDFNPDPNVLVLFLRESVVLMFRLFIFKLLPNLFDRLELANGRDWFSSGVEGDVLLESVLLPLPVER